MLGVGIGYRERHEVQAGVASAGGIELGSKGRIRRLEQDLDVACFEHRADIAGAGRLGCAAGRIGIDLHGDGRRGKAGLSQGGVCGLDIGHEVSDVVEKDLAGARQLRGVCGNGHRTDSKLDTGYRRRHCRPGQSARDPASARYLVDI